MLQDSHGSNVVGCRIVDKTCSAIVAKCLNGKTSAIMKATEALLCFVELEQGDKVMVGSRFHVVHANGFYTNFIVHVSFKDLHPC